MAWTGFKRTVISKIDEVLTVLNSVLERLSELEASVEEMKSAFRRTERRMSKELDDVRAAVDRETTVNQSAIALLGQLSDLIKANANDPAALAQIANDLNARADELSAAVTANTPAAPDAGGGTDTGGGNT